MDLWNFTGQAADKNAQKKIPAAADILALLPHINYKNIRIDGNTVTLTDPQTQVDLGFIAKGFIADRLKESLLEKGVESALINLGGNILAVGSKPDGSPFEIGVRNPFDTQNTALTTLSLSDRSLVSSGVYERYFERTVNATIIFWIPLPAILWKTGCWASPSCPPLPWRATRLAPLPLSWGRRKEWR